MFFDDWGGLVRVAVVGLLAYAGLVLLLRISGKRTLSKMNAFDLVVTVALGSTLATILLSSAVALAEGLLAFAVLIALQFAGTWLSTRTATVRRLVKNEPGLMVYEGKLLSDALRAERVTGEEIDAALRQQGMADLEDVGAAVLETDGSVTVVPRSGLGRGSALGNVIGKPPGPGGRRVTSPASDLQLSGSHRAAACSPPRPSPTMRRITSRTRSCRGGVSRVEAAGARPQTGHRVPGGRAAPRRDPAHHCSALCSSHVDETWGLRTSGRPFCVLERQDRCRTFTEN